MESKPSLYEDPLFRRAAGQSLRPGGLELTRNALARCGWPRGAAVAEVGCGAGATLRLLADLGFAARGYDLSRDLVAEAAAHSGCPVELADAAALPLADAAVDGLVCECLLSLLPDADEALDEFSRVLRPGGGLLLADVTLKRRGAGEPGREEASRRSCLDGAVTVDENIARLERHGFAVLETLDHPEALKALAVHLIWEGCGLSELASWLGFSCDGKSGASFGYTQWIARKA